ncbi:MAG: hypothetical protein KDB66_05410 [Solirubrobacterales bacterium]|nr:hypothetical protein [Solirubrobacterales bacterium]MCB8914403.1 hypothetical protein [Thermoleophilales bacterium]
MADGWSSTTYTEWRETCDTLHAHTQFLGKLCVALAPPEPQLQHAALRLTARGWETLPLPAPNGNGVFAAVLDLRNHHLLIEHSDGMGAEIALAPNRPVGEVVREALAAIGGTAGPVEIDPTPQEVSWTVPLDEDDEHRIYDPNQVRAYFEMATAAGMALNRFRAPFRGRSTPLNAWWGSFDLAVNLFSGRPAEPPSQDFIMRNAMDAQEVAVGWWPGDDRYAKPAFYAYAHPAEEGFSGRDLGPAPGRWSEELGEYLLDHEEAAATGNPEQAVIDFCGEIFSHACAVCDWNPALAASAAGDPPPIR